MVADRNFLLIYGGDDGTVNLLDDLHILDLDSLQWIAPRRTEGTYWPEARKNHTAVLHRGSMYLFGGTSSHCRGKAAILDVVALNLRMIPEMRSLSFDEASDAIQRDLQLLTGFQLGLPLPGVGAAPAAVTATAGPGAVGVGLVRHQHTASNSIPLLPVVFGSVPPSKSCSSLQAAAVEGAALGATASVEGAARTVTDEQLTESQLFDIEPTVSAIPLPEVRNRIETVLSTIRNQLVQLHQRMDRFTMEKHEFEEAVQRECERQEAAAAAATAAASSQSRRVTLNIGGQRFETTSDTLTKDKNSMLAVMFGRHDALVQRGDDGTVFLDRDGTRFRYVLNYLRDGSVYLPRDDPTLLHELRQEAEFYQIEGLRELVTRKLRKAAATKQAPPPM
eukprot:TRINITY_DN442_c0_g1_i4.p1 TRINITY_DN442_c0_g1~~TRINITY_DN442_c0_g1_i4.p1  ORF type:complete len:392 (+),score=101.82 TRINITY_DN442_c0_g1_i4:1051-2226(+)